MSSGADGNFVNLSGPNSSIQDQDVEKRVEVDEGHDGKQRGNHDIPGSGDMDKVHAVQSIIQTHDMSQASKTSSKRNWSVSEHSKNVEPHDNTIVNFSYLLWDINSKPIESQVPASRMSLALFLNAAIISDDRASEFEKPPFVLFGQVEKRELPADITFDREDPDSKIAQLISNKAVKYQRRSVREEQVSNVDVSKKCLYWNPKNDPFLSKIYHVTDLCQTYDMNIVGHGYQKWKQVQGSLVALLPTLKPISSVGFIFSEKDSSNGMQMETKRFCCANVLFYGKMEYDILDPSENARFLRENANLNSQDSNCKYSSMHQTWFIGTDVKLNYRFVTFAQSEAQVVILPPGIIYQARAATNCISANYNFIDDRWCSLPNNVIQDSCACPYGEDFLSNEAIGLLREDYQSRLLAKFYGTTKGQILEIKYSAESTAARLDVIGRLKAIDKKTSDKTVESSGDESTDNRVALFNGGDQQPLVPSAEPMGNMFSMLNSTQLPNGPSVVEKRNGSHNVQQLYHCTKCDHAYGTEKACMSHIASHDAKHICDICKRAFKTKSILQRHELKCLKPGPPYVCTSCGLTYGHVKSLDIHMATPGKCPKNPIVCGCGVQFNKQGFSNHKIRSECKFARKVAKKLKKRKRDNPFEMEITEVEPSLSQTIPHTGKKTRFGRNVLNSSEEEAEILTSDDEEDRADLNRASVSDINQTEGIPIVRSPTSPPEDVGVQDVLQYPSTSQRHHRIRHSYHVADDHHLTNNDDDDVDADVHEMEKCSSNES